MFKSLQSRLYTYCSHPEALWLIFLFAASLLLISSMGTILAPVFAAIIIAYLLDSWVNFLLRYMARPYAVTLVFLFFISLLALAVLVFIPLLWHQITHFVNDLPTLIKKAEASITAMADHWEYLSHEDVSVILHSLMPDMSAVKGLGKAAVSFSVATLPGLIAILVYLVLVPILILFFLKDKTIILQTLVAYLPQKKPALQRIWREVDLQIGNYVRGKVLEMMIVAIVTYISFLYFGLNYSILLSCLVGISVFIPYIGATIVTVPVAVVAALQWGLNSEFTYLMVTYGIIQALDGNVLVPLLFSEAVALHPIAIILAILCFGSLGGFWGIFFAIPLAALLKSVVQAWPTTAVDF